MTSAAALPRVTIGLPVFNGESSIATAIESITQQTFMDFKLIISDNASTDNTDEICRRFADADSRIEYHRQGSNIGAEANFDFVLRQADSEYFMWAAADDIRSPDYLDLCVTYLDSHADYVATTCTTRYADPSLAQWDMGDRSLESDDVFTNIINFFPSTPQWHANANVYSLFRLNDLLVSMHGIGHFLGSDWAIVVQALVRGKFHRIEQGHVLLGARGTSRQLNFFRKYRSRLIHWVIPFLEFSRIVMRITRHAPFVPRLRILKCLVFVNFQATIKHVKYEIRIYMNKMRHKTHG